MPVEGVDAAAQPWSVPVDVRPDSIILPVPKLRDVLEANTLSLSFQVAAAHPSTSNSV